VTISLPAVPITAGFRVDGTVLGATKRLSVAWLRMQGPRGEIDREAFAALALAVVGRTTTEAQAALLKIRSAGSPLWKGPSAGAG
jgi:hypothetical protein